MILTDVNKIARIERTSGTNPKPGICQHHLFIREAPVISKGGMKIPSRLICQERRCYKSTKFIHSIQILFGQISEPLILELILPSRRRRNEKAEHFPNC